MAHRMFEGIYSLAPSRLSCIQTHEELSLGRERLVCQRVRLQWANVAARKPFVLSKCPKAPQGENAMSHEGVS